MHDENNGKANFLLRVEEVISRDWFRSQIRARPTFLNDAQSKGHILILQSDISLVWLPHIGADIRNIKIEADTDIFLVCRG